MSVGRSVGRSMYLVLILNRKLFAGITLVLGTNEIGDGFVLGLLNGTLVVLRTLLEDVFLDEINAYDNQSRVSTLSIGACRGVAWRGMIPAASSICRSKGINK